MFDVVLEGATNMKLLVVLVIYPVFSRALLVHPEISCTMWSLGLKSAEMCSLMPFALSNNVIVFFVPFSFRFDIVRCISL